MSGKASPVAPQGKAPASAPARTTPSGAAGSRPPVTKNGAPAEEAIRKRAYALWEQAGHPWSDGVEFWLRAEKELASSQ